jgi:hypothetical protein
MASMQSESDKNIEIKTQFVTREGYYKLMTCAEYSRPNRLGYTTQSNNTPVKVSFVAINDTNNTTNNTTDRICFNVGRELYVYNYKGVKKVSFIYLFLLSFFSLFFSLSFFLILTSLQISLLFINFVIINVFVVNIVLLMN